MRDVGSISCLSSLDTERELSESDRLETVASGMACKKPNEVAKRPSKNSMKSDLVDPTRTTAHVEQDGTQKFQANEMKNHW